MFNPKSILILLSIAVISGPAKAQFLDFSQPARAAALGGNLVALPEGPSAMTYNPAGLAFQERIESTARYESLFPGLENDSISTGNLTLLAPLGNWGGSAGAWDHLGSNFLQQDRFQFAWGDRFSQKDLFTDLALGFNLSYLTQRYVLSTPLSGVSTSALSSAAFGLGGGFLLPLPWNLSLGFSFDDINQPNLGVVGTDLIPALFRWGLTERLLDKGPFRLTVTAAQSLTNSDLETQGGVECFFQPYGVSLRAGMGTYQGAVGLGYAIDDLFLDYAYLFSVAANSQIAGVGLPGSHLLEIGAKWGDSSALVTYGNFLKKAKDAETIGRWDHAFWYYQACLTYKPDDLVATDGRKKALIQYNLQRAENYYHDGQAAEAKEYYLEAQNDLEMAVKLGPNNPAYAQSLSELKQKLENSKITSSSITGTPTTSIESFVDITLQQVSDLLAKDDQKGAIQVLTDALLKDPDQPILKMVLKNLQPNKEEKISNRVQLLLTEADIYLSKERPDLAKKDLLEALKTDPENKEIQQRLAHLETSMKRVSPEKMKLAQDLYEKGLKMYLDGDLEGAMRAWEETLKIDPHHVKAQNNLIRAKLEKESQTP